MVRSALPDAQHGSYVNQLGRLLEDEFSGQLKFARQEFQLLINDRAIAPNTPETFEACRGEIAAFLSELGDPDAQLAHDGDPRRRFSVHVQLSRPLESLA